MPMSGSKQFSLDPAWPASRFRGVVTSLVLLLLLLILLAHHQDEGRSVLKELVSKLAWRNSSVRPPLLLCVVLFGWAYVVRVCRASSLNLELVLGGRLQHPTATLHAALTFTCVVLSAHLVHFVASEWHGLTWRPWLTCNLALHAALIVLGTMPAPIFHHESRFSLVQTLWESVIAPLAPVHFWHVIVADYLTSLAKAFADLQVSTCIAHSIMTEKVAAQRRSPEVYVPTSTLWETHYFSCAELPWNALMLAFPFWWRLMQCLKVYTVTKEQKNLWNALKYSTAFPLVYYGWLRRMHPGPKHDRAFILAAIVQSSYCFFWDVQMDWGLFVRDARSATGWRLREPLLITQRKWVHYLLCVFNLLLRFIWALAIFAAVPGRGLGMFFFETVEIVRRTFWAIFRIEWEVVCKVHYSDRAARELEVVRPLRSERSDCGSDAGSSEEIMQGLAASEEE